MVYIEGLGDGKRFIDKVSKVTVNKPVIALKPGRTDAAAKAISSHSGSMSGTDAVYDAAFKKSGVIRVDTSHEMLDLAIAMIHQPLPLGRNVVITTPGGSYGVMCADACAVRGLDVIDLPTHILNKFNEMFPSRWSHGNPVDPAGDRNFIPYFKAPKMLLECPEVDGLIFMGFGSFSGFADTWGSAGGDITKRVDEMREKIKGFKDGATAFAKLIDDEDYDKIRMILKTIVAASLGSVMTIDPDDLEEFSDDASVALTSARMQESSFYKNLREFLGVIISGNIEEADMSKMAELSGPLIDSLIESWITKYNKPVITTTFTEGTSVVGELGHFPYPNADRAANVLAKLVEYREYLESAEERDQ
jgi:succinyl-CoA ligase-like protein/CoA ligase-like protein